VKVGRVLVAVAAGALFLAASGILNRSHEEERVAKRTEDMAIPTLALIAPSQKMTGSELVLPGDVEAYYTASLHGQTSGYVREWRKDIGAHVKAGEVLAIVDTPELAERVAAAEGDLARATANTELARVTAQRWSTLRNSSAVSQQAVDEKESDARAKEAEETAAQANLARLKAEQSFDEITSPFDGVITSRNVDVGTLVRADSDTGPALFTVADVHQMRIYVHAPESYAASLKPGMKATLQLAEYPGRSFEATISTTSDAIDQKSRSLLVELLADNKDGALTPGAFARVRFQLPPNPDLVRLPANALLFRNDSVSVAIVGQDGKISLKPVRIARDLGSEVEVDSDFGPSARIVANPPETLADGDEVRIAPAGREKSASFAGVMTKPASNSRSQLAETEQDPAE
jgi:RND family efflux transporter MFP subunit